MDTRNEKIHHPCHIVAIDTLPGIAGMCQLRHKILGGYGFRNRVVCNVHKVRKTYASTFCMKLWEK